MGNGPLADSRLQEIESRLNAGRFDEAQRLLSTIGNLPNAETASAYFATRLLFQRGRMDQSGVIQRLRELLVRVPEFPEAARMLAAAEAGVLAPDPEVFRRVTGAPDEHDAEAQETPLGRAPTQREIPRPPLVPRFTPRSGTPSYAPSTPLAPRGEPAPPLPPIPSLNQTLHGVGSHPEQANAERAERARLPTMGAGALPLIPSLEMPAINTISTQAPPPEPEPPPPSRSARPIEGRSGAYSVRAPAPSLFEIAAALDAGQPGRALELTEQVALEAGPELLLLAARALLALGQRARAAERVERVLRTPTLEPPVRATAARILIELGRLDLALANARRAVREAPEDTLSQVTCAWALVRSLRRKGEPALAIEAETLLTSVTLPEGPIATLVTALRAALAAQRRRFDEALSLAERALAQDPRQIDALATLEIAAAALGKTTEAERARRRLRELAPEETAASDGRQAPEPRDATKARPDLSIRWGAEEAALARGDATACSELLVRKSRDALRAQQRRGGTEAWRALAMHAARLLTELPVFRHFAPYDCSVFSVDRLEAALGLLFGSGGAPSPLDEAAVVLLGAYVGESWRQAFGADWHGVLSFPFAASVQGIGLLARPCERVRERIERGVTLAIETPHSLHPGADPLGNSVPLSLVPPAPWDPAAFPSVEDFRTLGRELDASIIGVYCERTLGLPLELSLSSVVTIDRYVALLAPSKAPPDPDARWARRVALLLGAYLGEVLVDAVGANWENIVAPKSLEDYRLILPHGNAATPALRVEERLTGRRPTPLAEYVARLASGRNSISA